MSDETPDLTTFTRALASAPPNPGRFDRDALLFAAGRSAGRRGRFWPAVAASLALLSGGLGAALVFRPPTVVEVVRFREPEKLARGELEGPAKPQAAEEAAPLSPPLPQGGESALPPEWAIGLRLREQVLREGLSALPPSVAFAPSPRPTSDEVPDLAALRLNARP